MVVYEVFDLYVEFVVYVFGGCEYFGVIWVVYYLYEVFMIV